MIDLVFVDAFINLFTQPIAVYLLAGIPTFIAIVVSLLLVLRKWGDFG
jgi:hypothetical protein